MMRTLARRMAILGLVFAASVATSAAAFQVFVDPTETGTPPSATPELAAGASAHNVWIVNGPTASDPNFVCSGTGTGDEVCGWDLLLDTTGLVAIQSFTPNGDVVFNIETPGVAGNLMRMNGGNPINPLPLAEKVGVVTVNTTGLGTLRANGNLFVTSDLAATAVPVGTLAEATDADVDGLLDADDNCPNLFNPGGIPFADTGSVPTPGDPDGILPDGIGDPCQCGDVSNDGIVKSPDNIFIQRSCLGLPPFPTACTTSTSASAGPNTFVFGKCNVTAGTSCDGVDATIVQRAALGLPPGVQNNCTGEVFP